MKRARIAVLVSGAGRSLDNLGRLARAGELEIEIALVLADRPGIRALEIAAEHGLQALWIDWKRCGGAQEFSERAFGAIERAGAELIVLAGFLRKLVLPERWLGRALNIHPALLPDFGGQGYYGDKVHAAVLASGAKESGCTVHYVDNEYDRGPILLQKRVPVLPGDDAHALAARVFEEEQRALPEAIRRHFAQRSGIAGGGG